MGDGKRDFVIWKGATLGLELPYLIRIDCLLPFSEKFNKEMEL